MSSIYQRFCTEIKDENGGLKKLTLNYPDNFNFGYDVVNMRLFHLISVLWYGAMWKMRSTYLLFLT